MSENHIILSQAVIDKVREEGNAEALPEAIVQEIKRLYGENITARALQELTPSQITLWGYYTLREELMDGGFVQLVYNGYGPFFFDNPFAKAMRLWGLKELSKLIYKAKKVYDAHREELTRERSDEEFMALFEQYPEFDDLDDEFVEEEEDYSAQVAEYVAGHLEDFGQITPTVQ